jgi:ribosomal-protein-alanine N-acetyltransferase
VSKELETERLVIRNFQLDDWKDIQALAINKETSEFARYDHTWPTSDDGCKDTAKYLAEKSDKFFAVCLKEDGQLIGLIAFNSIDETRTLDLGHLFHTDYLSGDIMFEALRRMVQYAFDELEIDRIGAHNVPEWIKQITPLKSIGFTPIEGDPGHLGITKEEWDKRRK